MQQFFSTRTCPRKPYYKWELRDPHVDIFSHTLYCICLFINPTHPVFLQSWAFRCFYSLLCSLRQQLCPRSAIPALQSGRLPQTTPHSGDEPSSDLGCAKRQRDRVGQLCQALPSRVKLSSGSQYLPNNREVFFPFSFIYNTRFIPVYYFQMPDPITIAVGCTAFSDFAFTLNACVTHTQSSIWPYMSL